ncbi:MAG: allophanate hydrolase, partial [Hyphomicrobium sp.]
MNISFDISTLGEGYRTGRFTPLDVIDEIYARIARSGEQPVWISVVPHAIARARAQAAPRGPLYGIPFAVKDNIDVAGLPTTCACPGYAYTPARSATVVERLEAAGALVIGKTNLDQFATGLVGTRSPYGIPSSVFNADYISGGSSSGSAVAVASGLVSFALGTDTAGSGRVPAAFNNIVGLKPTKGIFSARGVVPACKTLDTVSIFALTVSDAACAATIATAYDPEDSFSRRFLDNGATNVPDNIRVGIPSGVINFCGDQLAKEQFFAAVERMRGLGADITEIDFSSFQKAAQLLYEGPWVGERFAAVGAFATRNTQSLDETVAKIILGANGRTAADAFQGIYRLAELVRAAEGEWQKMDVLMLPSAPTTYRIADVLADPIALNSNLGLYTNFVNLMDLSAIAVPAGFRTDGLPSGVTLIARAFQDALIAGVGDRLHRALDDAKLGATSTPLAATPPLVAQHPAPGLIQVAVVGAHLQGQPLNSQLTERNARLVRVSRTGTGYSFYALANTSPAKPGLIFDGNGAGDIEVEIWEMDEKSFGSFVALIPAPLGIGTVKLTDGS